MRLGSFDNPCPYSNGRSCQVHVFPERFISWLLIWFPVHHRNIWNKMLSGFPNCKLLLKFCLSAIIHQKSFCFFKKNESLQSHFLIKPSESSPILLIYLFYLFQHIDNIHRFGIAFPLPLFFIIFFPATLTQALAGIGRVVVRHRVCIFFIRINNIVGLITGPSLNSFGLKTSWWNSGLL